MKMPTKIYERLTPNERFLAFVEAAARRDEEELERLNVTCPMKTYQIEDPAYFLPKTNAMLITLSAHVDAAWHSELASFSMALLILGSGKHEEKAVDSLGVFVRRYRTHMDGFAKFCDAIGVNAESLRQALGCRVGPMTKMALQIADDYVDTVPAPDEVNAIANQLLAVWRAPGVV
jgi:hypothetical protein